MPMFNGIGFDIFTNMATTSTSSRYNLEEQPYTRKPNLLAVKVRKLAIAGVKRQLYLEKLRETSNRVKTLQEEQKVKDNMEK